MKKRTTKIIVCLLLMVGSFSVWLFFRPLMVFFGLGGSFEPTAGCGSESLLQLINGAYLLLSNGLLTVGILAAVGLYGFWVLKVLELDNQDAGIRILFSLGLGLTELSLSVLILGLLGFLNRWVFVALLAAMAGAGVICLLRGRKHTDNEKSSNNKTSGAAFWLAMLIIPLAMLAVLAAMLPAGILWDHDGRGYDALEYHLQLPREYMEAGRIGRVDHNVYSNFPANAELLYLLAMVLKGDAIEGMYLGQLLNLALAGIFAAGVYFLARRWGQIGAVIAAMAVAGPQLFFVATNAYAECYMLLMFLLALGCVFYGTSNEKAETTSCEWRWFLLAGIFAGAACGSKYMAVVMVLPVVVLAGIALAKRKLSSTAVLLAGSLVIFSPWLIKNVCYRSNPIFPLAAKQLGQDNWNEQQVDRWNRAHRASEELTAGPMRLRALGRELIDPGRYGTGVIIAVVVLILSGFRAWGRGQKVLLGGLGVQILVWMAFTHLQTRFLLPLVVPLAFLVGRCWPKLAGKPKGRLVVALAVVGVVLNTVIGVSAYNRSTAKEAGELGFWPLAGRDDLVGALYPFGVAIEQDKTHRKVLLVGEARTFYVTGAEYVYNTVFDRCVIDELLATKKPKEALEWLKREHFTHVYVNWLEVQRLQKYYGFGDSVNRDNFVGLERAGLRLMSAQQGGFRDSHHISLYEIAVK